MTEEKWTEGQKRFLAGYIENEDESIIWKCKKIENTFPELVQAYRKARKELFEAVHDLVGDYDDYDSNFEESEEDCIF